MGAYRVSYLRITSNDMHLKKFVFNLLFRIDYYFNCMGTVVLFNGSCPICNAEICHYRDYTIPRGIPIEFHDLHVVDPSKYGVSWELAMKRLHIVHEGQILTGMSAFQVLWAQLPRYKWLSLIVSLPVFKQFFEITYDHMIAPTLYRMHLRRQKRS